MFPIGRQEIRKELRHLGSFTFEGTGIVFTGYIRGAKNYVAQVEMYVDGKIIERAVLPTGKNHRVDLFWKYQLPEGKHIVTFKWLNPDPMLKSTVMTLLSTLTDRSRFLINKGNKLKLRTGGY